MAIRSQAWVGNGVQEGSETSGVSPNNNPRRRAPGLPFDRRTPGFPGEGEIVQASRKREDALNPLVAGSNPAGRIGFAESTERF